MSELSVAYALAATRLGEWEDASTFQWIILDNTYVPNTVSDRYVADVTAAELTDGSYARVTMTGGAISTDDSSVVFDADDPTFSSLAGTTDPAWLVCAYDTGVDASDELICALRVSHDPDGNDWTPSISASGVLRAGDGRQNYISET